MKTDNLKELICRKIGTPIPPWEQEYLNYHAARFTDTLDLLGPGEGKRLLDLGAFPGHLTLAVQELGYRVQALTGRDESARGLQNFISRLSAHNIPVFLTDVEKETFPFPDKSFEVVLAAEIIEHLPYNPYHLLREAFRVLKPGGRILLTTPNISKLDNLLHFVRGRTIHPEIRLPFHKTFKSILIGRHMREFTAPELEYMLEEQNKAMYRFGRSRVTYTMCLDPAFSWSRAFPWIIKKLWPRFRATIFIESYRPQNLELLPPETITTRGLYEVEEHPADMGSTGRILATPFRWTHGQAEIVLPSSGAEYQIFYIHLVFLAPKGFAQSILTLSVGQVNLGLIGLPPGREYIPLCLALPAHLAQEGDFVLRLKNPTWVPAEYAAQMDYYEFSPTDIRNLGIAIGWDGFLREDCHSLETLMQAARREVRRHPLSAGYEGRWSHLSGLYLIQARLKSSLSLGPGDWRQLGQGWHHLERWRQGWMRWSGGRSEVFLEPGKHARQLRIHVYTGEESLGREIHGILKVEYARDRLAFFPLTQMVFALPSDSWTDLIIDLPSPLSPEGLLRIVISVDRPRVPADLMPHSQDRRELGLAVFDLKIG